MFNWIIENLATILVGLVVLAVFVGIVVSQIKAKRQGKSSCACGCAGCAMSGSCHGGK